MPRQRKKTKDTKMRIAKPSVTSLNVSFLQSVPNKRLFFSTPIIAIVTIIIVIALHSYLPPQVPLFYGLPEGEDQLGSSFSLVIPSIIALAVFVINSALIYLIDDSFIENTLVVATFTVALFSSITTIKIMILINSFLSL